MLKSTMSRIRWWAVVGVPIAGMFLTGLSAAASASLEAREPAILRIRISGSSGTAEGTAFLVHQTPREHDIVHYFVTAANLLDPEPLGETRAASLRIHLVVDEATVIEASGGDAIFPGGLFQGLDLAVVKAVSTSAVLTPVAVSMEAPGPGDVFLVKGRQQAGLTVLTERVRFRSSRLVIGDRTAADVSGLMGAPATAERGVFGLVTECSPTRAPVITLLDAARGFLSRAIPGWTPPADRDGV